MAGARQDAPVLLLESSSNGANVLAGYTLGRAEFDPAGGVWRGDLAATGRRCNCSCVVAELLLLVISFQGVNRPRGRGVLGPDPEPKNPWNVPGGRAPRTGAQGRVLHQKQVGERRPKVCAVQILFPIVLLFLRGIKNTIAASTIDHHFVVPKLVP